MASFAAGILSLTLFAATAVKAIGEPCQIANSKLDPNSHKFRSDCGPQDYCAVSLANTGSISAAIKRPPAKRDGVDHTLRNSIDGTHYHNTGFSNHKHETRLSRRGILQNVFLAAVVDSATNETTNMQEDELDTPMITEKDDGSPSPFGVNATGTCQPKGCRKDEFPFG